MGRLLLNAPPNPPDSGTAVESRYFFEGTVTATDMSRATDSREKSRMGIFGTSNCYEGNSGRVLNEALGRDFNPLGRGGGLALVGGAVSLGTIAPFLPGAVGGYGTGTSVNNDAGVNMGDGGMGCVGCSVNGCCGAGCAFSCHLCSFIPEPKPDYPQTPCTVYSDLPSHVKCTEAGKRLLCECIAYGCPTKRGCCAGQWEAWKACRCQRYGILHMAHCTQPCGPCTPGFILPVGGDNGGGPGGGNCPGCPGGRGPIAKQVGGSSGNTVASCQDAFFLATQFWQNDEKREECLCLFHDKYKYIKDCLVKGMKKLTSWLGDPEKKYMRYCASANTTFPNEKSGYHPCANCKTGGWCAHTYAFPNTLDGKEYIYICCNMLSSCNNRGDSYCSNMDTIWHEAIHLGGCQGHTSGGNTKGDFDNTGFKEFVLCMCYGMPLHDPLR